MLHHKKQKEILNHLFSNYWEWFQENELEKYEVVIPDNYLEAKPSSIGDFIEYIDEIMNRGLLA